jgi:repressor LexA
VGLTSSSSVHAQLANLERMGLLTKDPTKPRAMALAAEPKAPSIAVPVVGRIAAGAPILAEEHVEEYVAVPETFADDREHFALRVSGDSMIGAGIVDGDLVVVRAQSNAQEGDIVAAVLPGPAEDEATVKRFHRDGDRIVLVPENPSMQPFEMSDGRIAGKVVAVLRRL